MTNNSKYAVNKVLNYWGFWRTHVTKLSEAQQTICWSMKFKCEGGMLIHKGKFFSGCGNLTFVFTEGQRQLLWLDFEKF